MAKKTAVEYEAMIGGLMRRIDDLEERSSTYYVNWQMKKEAIEERCIKRLLELVPMSDPELTADYLREELAKDA
jgi:hypothetical protein